MFSLFKPKDKAPPEASYGSLASQDGLELTPGDAAVEDVEAPPEHLLRVQLALTQGVAPQDNLSLELVHGVNAGVLRMFMPLATHHEHPNVALIQAQAAVGTRVTKSRVGHCVLEMQIESLGLTGTDSRDTTTINWEHDLQVLMEDEPADLLSKDDIKLLQREALKLQRPAFMCDRHGNEQPLDIERALEAQTVVLMRVCKHASADATSYAEPLMHCLVVLNELRELADPTMRFGWLPLRPVHGVDGKHVAEDAPPATPEPAPGRMLVGFQYSEPSVAHEKMNAVSAEVFEKYDLNGDGYLSLREFQTFTQDLHNAGGRIKKLAKEQTKKSCAAVCLSWLLGAAFAGQLGPIQQPTVDLNSYIEHYHSLATVYFGPLDGSGMVSTITERAQLLLSQIVWSFSANCLVEKLYDAPRTKQIVAILFIDTMGTTILSTLFSLTHIAVLVHCCERCTRHRRFRCLRRLPGIVFIIWCVSFLISLVVTMSPEELFNSSNSFFGLYATARVTEVYQLGTKWAMMVQFGQINPSVTKSASLERQGSKRMCSVRCVQV